MALEEFAQRCLRLWSLQMSKRYDTMGKWPIVRIRNPRRLLRPFGRQLELPRKQMRERAT